LAEKWSLIPSDTDVLITHGPPYGILDQCHYWDPYFGIDYNRNVHIGCRDLLNELKRIKPKVHIFGHIHESYGQMRQDDITFINASHMTGNYEAKNPPIVVDI